MKKLLCIFFSIPLFFNAFSQKTIVSGVALNYSGQELTINTYTDEIVFSQKELGKAIVDNNGHFSIEFDIKEITTCFISTGLYHAIFFAEPQKKHEITLPPFKPLTENQQRNPYFKQEKLLLSVKNNTLNNEIAEFEDAFDHYYFKAALNPQTDSIKQFITRLSLLFPTSDNTFLKNYKEYKYAMLLNLIDRYAPTLAIKTYFSTLPVSYTNNSFWESFNVVFNNFFNAFGSSGVQQTIDLYLKNNNYEALCLALEQNFDIHDKQLQELIILKGLYDAYFHEGRNPENILALLNKWQTHITTPENRQIAKNMVNYLDNIAQSYKAFNLTLPDENGNMLQLNNLQGKYIYLNFCSSRIPFSKKDFGILERYAQLYEQDLYVVNVFMENSKDNMDSFVKTLKTNRMINLFGGSTPELMQQFNIVTIPTYFLLDRHGTFILSPAPTPDEDFEVVFERILLKDEQENPKPKYRDEWWK